MGADTAKREESQISGVFFRDVVKVKADIGCGVEERRDE